MLSNGLVMLAGLAAVSAQSVSVAQGYAPAPSRLTMTQSGVLPIAPTPFPGVDTIEGAITYDGLPMPGFTGPGGNASAQTGNPQTSYMAVLPAQQFNPFVGSTIQGSIMGKAAANGTGVMFTINFTMLPSEAMYGPFAYHIHNLPIGADGNCTASLGHLDPTNRGELYACDVANPQSCQVGDLSGKHGNITLQTGLQTTYLDPYFSTTPGSPYFFGDKSIVIHSSNTTRLTCANFSMLAVSPSSSSSAAAQLPTSMTSSASVVRPSVIIVTQGSDGQIQGTGAAGTRAATASSVVVSTTTVSSSSMRPSATAAYTGGVGCGKEVKWGMGGVLGGLAGAWLAV